MPGFLFPRQVKLLGVKIIEPAFLHNILHVLNIYSDDTFLKETWGNWQRKKCSVDTISLWDLFLFYFALYKLAWDLASSFPFSNQSFFVLSHEIHSILQFFTGSFAVDFGNHLRSRIICGHFGDHLRSRDHLPLGIICGTVQGASSRGLLFSLRLLNLF